MQYPFFPTPSFHKLLTHIPLKCSDRETFHHSLGLVFHIRTGFCAHGKICVRKAIQNGGISETSISPAQNSPSSCVTSQKVVTITGQTQGKPNFWIPVTLLTQKINTPHKPIFWRLHFEYHNIYISIYMCISVSFFTDINSVHFNLHLRFGGLHLN